MEIEKQIGILCDVSGSMEDSFGKLKQDKKINKKLDEIIGIIEKISNKINVKIFSLAFGCKGPEIFDLIKLLKICCDVFPPLDQSSSNVPDQNNNFKLKIVEKINSCEINGKRVQETNLKDYLNREKFPSNRLCEFIYYIIRNDPEKTKIIYNELPDYCKKKSLRIGAEVGLNSAGVGIGATIGGVIGSVVPVTGTVIGAGIGAAVGGGSFIGVKKTQEKRISDENIIKCVRNSFRKTMSVVIAEIVSKYKNSNNGVTEFLKGEEVYNLIKDLDKKIEFPDEKVENCTILDLFKDHIYGMTPMYQAFKKSFNIFKEQKVNKKNSKKVIIIISDGLLNDKNYNDAFKEIKENAKQNTIYIIGIFLSNEGKDNNINPRKFYDNDENFKSNGAKFLFNISEKITYQNPIFRFFLGKNWDLPISGECNLFVSVNNSENLNEFIDLINEALNYSDPNNNIVNLVATCSLNSYINAYNSRLEARSQIFGTCWANAFSAVIHLAQKRIIGREVESVEWYRDHLLVYYSIKDDDGNSSFETLTNINLLKQKNLHIEKVSENEARIAIMKGRPCIAEFCLSGGQWDDFCNFFKKYKTGILKKSDISDDNSEEESGGHAVILIGIGKNYLEFLGSWGTCWANNGKFKIENADVLTGYVNDVIYKMQFYDVFWYEEELSPYERNYYEKNKNKFTKSLDLLLQSELNKDEIKNKIIECDFCNGKSNAMNYYGNIFYVQCPLCKKIYEPTNQDLRNCLCLNEVLGEEKKIDNSEDFSYTEKILDVVRTDDKKDNKIFNIQYFERAQVNGLILLKDKRIASCFSNGSIKIFGNTIITRENAHPNIRTICEIRNNILSSGGRKDIKIWKIEKNYMIQLYHYFYNNCHEDFLNKIITIDNNCFSSCAKDGKINFYNYDLDNDRYIHVNLLVNNCHSRDINCILKLDWEEDIIASGSNEDRCLIFWNYSPNGLTEKKNFSNIDSTSYNGSLLEINNCLLVGENKGIRIFSYLDETKDIIQSGYFEEDIGKILTMTKLYNDYFICGRSLGFCSILKIINDKKNSKEIKIKIINIVRNNLKTNGKDNDYAITCLCKNDDNNETKGKFYVGSFDGTINEYEFDFHN